MTGPLLKAKISLEFQSYWCAGTGGGRGRHLDAVCHRDTDGFPAMAMSEIKGTLRETAWRLAEDETAGWTPDLVVQLFGKRDGESHPAPNGGEQDFPAALSFLGEARMSPADRSIDNLADNTFVLFKRIAGTKIDKMGVAEEKTLRFVECSVPLRIEGVIEWQAAGEPLANWVELLDSVAAATVTFGKAKNDGNGRAIAEVNAVQPDPVASIGISEDLLAASKVVLILTQARPAIFSERAATEAGHRTLPAPTGAALLGWCAAKGQYGDFNDSFAVFHSGAMRFGNAVPVQEDGTLPVAFPRNLFKPKEKKAIDDDGKLDANLIYVGTPPPIKSTNIQYEVVKKAFLAAGNTALSPSKGQRLRTATEQGRAAKGKLFGYQHLGAEKQNVYAAVIGRNDVVTDRDWRRLLATFAGKTLALGRAKNTGYGGGFSCELQLPDERGAFQSIPATDRVRVLALSELALIDDNGCPSCHPVAGMFDLPRVLSFDAGDSVILQRRFAPWNGKLHARDLERQVIEAGSVISFKVPPRTEVPQEKIGRGCFGMWREVGFGQVWINPEFLAGDRLVGELNTGKVIINAPEEGEDDIVDQMAGIDNCLRAWCASHISGGVGQDDGADA